MMEKSNGTMPTENDNNNMIIEEDPDSPGPIIINHYSIKPPDDVPSVEKLTSTTSETQEEEENKDEIVENGSKQPDKNSVDEISKDGATRDNNTEITSSSPTVVVVKEDKDSNKTPLSSAKEDKKTNNASSSSVKEEKKTTTPVPIKKEWSLLTCEVCKASFLSSQGLKSHQTNSAHYPNGEKLEEDDKNDYRRVSTKTTTTPSSSSMTEKYKVATKRKLSNVDVKSERPSTTKVSPVKSTVKVDTKIDEKVTEPTTTTTETTVTGDPRNMSLDEAMQLAQVNAFGFFSCLVCRSSFLSSQGLRSHYQNSCLASSLTRKNLEKLEPPTPPPVPESPVAKKSKKEPKTPKVRAKKVVEKPPVKRGRGRPRKVQEPESTDEEEEYESESEEEVEEPPQEESDDEEEEQDDDNNYYYDDDAEEPQQDDNDYEDDYENDDDDQDGQYEDDSQDNDYWSPTQKGNKAMYMVSSPATESQQQVGRHPCKICDDSYNNKLHLHAHYRSHKKPYVCKICSVTFVKIGLFKSHECQAGFAAAPEYQQAARPQKVFTCPILDCGKGFVSKATLKVHLKSHAKKYHGCPDCPKKYLSKHDLSTHIQAVHVRKAINCPKCDKSFASMGHLFAHMKDHAEYQKQFKCHLCPSSFDSRPSLARHYQNHPVAMRVQGGAANSKETTTSKTSKQNVTKGKGRPSKKQESGDDDDDAPLTCNVCQKQFVNERTLSRHVQTAHGKRGAASAFECSDCDMSFNREQELRSHCIFIHTLNHGKRR